VTSRFSRLLAIPAPAEPMPTRRKESGTPREQYRMHRVSATTRGIPFNLTFNEWFHWWQTSGHYHERGKGRGQYVMGRKGDQGAYELGNIECVQAQENSVVPHTGKPKSNAWKAKIRNTMASKRKEASQ
jgi:hypothetical protein